MRNRGALFFFVLLNTAFALATHYSIFVPSEDSFEPGCRSFLESIVVDPLSGSRYHDTTQGLLPESAHQIQWDFIGPVYDTPAFGDRDRAEMRTADTRRARLFPQHLALIVRHDQVKEREMRIRAWERFYSNVPMTQTPLRQVEFDYTQRVPNSVPIESNPGFYDFFENYRDANGKQIYRYRMEPGRFNALAEPHRRERPFSMFEGMRAFIELIPEDREHPIMMVAECIDQSKATLLNIGFREIPMEEVRRVSPEATFLNTGSYFVVMSVEEFRRLYITNIEEAIRTPEGRDVHDPNELYDRVRRIDAAVARTPERGPRLALDRANFEKANALLELGEVAGAQAVIEILEARGHDNPAISLLRLRLEIMRRYDPLHQRGNLGEALTFLNVPATQQTYQASLPIERNGLHPLDYYRAWLQLESGQYQQAAATVEGILPQIRRNGVRFLFPGGQRDEARFEVEAHGVSKANELTRILFDPITNRGDARRALLAINYWIALPPYGITRSMRQYRAQVLRALGRITEANTEEARAAALPGAVDPL